MKKLWVCHIKSLHPEKYRAIDEEKIMNYASSIFSNKRARDVLWNFIISNILNFTKLGFKEHKWLGMFIKLSWNGFVLKICMNICYI